MTKRLHVPLFAECLSYLNRPASSTEWFPFPTNFHIRPSVVGLSAVNQAHAVRILSACCRLRSCFLSADLSVLCEQIGVDARRFDIQPFLDSGFLSEEGLIDREIDRARAESERATPDEVKAILDEAMNRKKKRRANK